MITEQFKGLSKLYFVQLLNNFYIREGIVKSDLAVDYVQNIASTKERYIYLTKKNVV
jgi:hypothetical protein